MNSENDEPIAMGKRDLFVHNRRIVWGDTDAAGIVYTVRIPQFCMEAIEAWFINRLGLDWFELNTSRHIGTPFVNMSVDFRSPLTPRDQLSTTVTLKRVGNSSLCFSLAGHSGSGELAFEASFTCVFVDNTEFQPIPVPDEFRHLL